MSASPASAERENMVWTQRRAIAAIVGTALTVCTATAMIFVRFGRDTKTLEDTVMGLTAVKLKLESELATVRLELAASESKVRADAAEKRAEMRQTVSDVDGQLKASIESLEKRFDRRMGDVEAAVRTMTETVVRMDERLKQVQRSGLGPTGLADDLAFENLLLLGAVPSG